MGNAIDGETICVGESLFGSTPSTSTSVVSFSGVLLLARGLSGGEYDLTELRKERSSFSASDSLSLCFFVTDKSRGWSASSFLASSSASEYSEALSSSITFFDKSFGKDGEDGFTPITSLLFSFSEKLNGDFRFISSLVKLNGTIGVCIAIIDGLCCVETSSIDGDDIFVDVPGYLLGVFLSELALSFLFNSDSKSFIFFASSRDVQLSMLLTDILPSCCLETKLALDIARSCSMANLAAPCTLRNGFKKSGE